MQSINEMQSINVKSKNDPNTSYTIHAHGELMKNRVAASPFSLENNIKVAKDGNGHPIVFTIGNDGELRVIYRDEESHSGWSELDFQKDIMKATDDIKTANFDVYQHKDGKISFVVTTTGEGRNGYALKGAKLEPTPKLWDKSHMWLMDRGEYPIVALGESPNSDDFPLVVFVKKIAGSLGIQTYYDRKWGDLVGLKVRKGFQFSHLVLGQYQHQPRAYVMYSGIDEKGLKCNYSDIFSLHRGGRINSLVHYDVNDLSTFQILPDNNGNCYGYFGAGGRRGSGFVAIMDDTENSFHYNHPIFLGAKTDMFPKMSVSQTSTTVSAWMLDEGKLFNAIRPFNDPNGWSPELQMDTDVVQIAALSNTKTDTNDLVFIKKDGSLHYMYHDPVTTLWRTEQIVLPVLDTSIEYTSYTTEISIWEDDQLPMPIYKFKLPDEPIDETPFRLTASERCYVMVNHQQYLVGPDLVAKVTTDHSGMITIINQVGTLSTPTFTLNAEFFAEEVLIEPSANVQEKLKPIDTGTKLKDAPTQSGIPLFSGVDVTDNKLDQAAKALKKLSDYLEKKPADRDTIANGAFGILGGQYKEGNAAHDRFPEGIEEGIGHFLEHGLGGLFHSLEHGLQKAGDWVLKTVGDVTTFIIDIGGKVLKFVIETATQVFHVITWVLKDLGLDLEKLIDWLGFVFRWDDILQTHNAIVSLFNSGIDKLTTDITEGEIIVKEIFEKLKEKIGTPGLVAQLGENGKMPTSGINKHGATSTQKADPRSGFASYHLHSPAAQKATAAYQDNFFASLEEKLKNDLYKFLDTEIETIKNAFNAIAEDIKGKSLEDSLKIIIEVIGITILQHVEEALIALAAIAMLFLLAVKDILNMPWHIPVLSELYKEITHEDMSILDVSCLVLAIPITIIYKLEVGEAPFSPDQSDYLKSHLSTSNGQSLQVAGVAETTEIPKDLALALNFLLGGVGTCITRTVSGEIGLIGVLAKDKLPPRFYVVKFIASLTGYIFTILNKIVLSFSPTGGGKKPAPSVIEDVMVYGQGIWPILNLLAIAKNDETKKAIGKSSLVIGGLSTVLFAVQYLEESTGPDGDAGAAFPKFLENFALGINQTTTPIVKMTSDLPRVQIAVIVLNQLGLGTTVLTNDIRASDAFTNGKTFKPI